MYWSIRNLTRWASGDFISCGYTSTDDSPLSTGPPIVTQFILPKCMNADTHHFYMIPLS
jgi:hypothetical protein